LPVEPFESRAMRMPRLRLTVRGMMVAVALMSIASLGWATWMNRRSSYCRRQAEWHAHEQWRLAHNMDAQLDVAGRSKDLALASFLRYDAERYRQGSIWHGRREQDFRRAMWQPWEPFPNYPRDPPWPAIPANLYPPGADPKDFWISVDGHWGTRAQILSRPLPSTQ